MPKPFKLVIEVEESATGPVMRRLHNMPGVVSMHLDLDEMSGTKRGPYKKNGGAGDTRPTGMRGELLALLSNKPILRRAIHAALNPSNDDGRKISVRNAIYNCERDGLAKNTSSGVVITEKGKAALKAKGE